MAVRGALGAMKAHKIAGLGREMSALRAQLSSLGLERAVLAALDEDSDEESSDDE